MAPVEFLNSGVVGDCEAGESPLLAQDLLQKPRVGMRRNAAIVFVVRRHHCFSVGVLHHLLKRVEKYAAHGALGKVVGAYVGSVFRLPMHEVLERGVDVIFIQTIGVGLQALKTSHRGCSQLADKVRVLGIHLFHAAVARVAAQIEDRRRHEHVARRARFYRHFRKHLFQQFRIPRASQTDGCRERRRPGPDRSMQRFAVEHDGNAQARILQDPRLEQVPALRSHPGLGRIRPFP